MPGLIPMFTLATFFRSIDRYVDNKEQEIAFALAFEGEKFVNNARQVGEYQDRTSNLRGSIAYDVVKNGKSFARDIKGTEESGEEAKYFAEKAIDEVIIDGGLMRDDFIWLIGVAGMEYASPVESKGFDVITSSIPKVSDINSLLKDAGLQGRFV